MSLWLHLLTFWVCSTICRRPHFGFVQFWVRERLQIKVREGTQPTYKEQKLLPGAASKLFGCLTFLNRGCHGKLEGSGLNATKECQYSKHANLPASILRSLEHVKALRVLQPRRKLPMQVACRASRSCS